MNQAQASRKPPMFPILLAAFIDMVGIGIVIPVVTPLIINNETGIVPAHLSPFWRDILLGLLLTTFPLTQFFGAPMLGALSDRYGRKPILAISMLGSMVGYSLFALGIVYSNLPLIFLGQLIDGFTGGNISIVYSSMADLSTPDQKARNFGLVGMMAGIGFVVGPGLGGVLANPDIVSWFNPALPYLVASGLCALNVVLLMAIFRETLKEKRPGKVNPFAGIRNIRKASSLPNLRTLFAVVFLLSVGFTFFTTFFNVFMVKKFDFEVDDIGWLFLYVGVWIAFTQGVVVRWASKKFKPDRVLRFSTVALALVLLACLLPSKVWMIYALVPFVALSHGIGQPNLTALVSGKAGEGQQGMVLGISQSMTSLGHAATPLLAGLISGFNYYGPTVAAAFFTLAGWAVFMLFFRAGDGRMSPSPNSSGAENNSSTE